LTPRNQLSKRWLGAAALVTAVLVVVAGYDTSPWFRRQVGESFSRQPTPFTALFFTDGASLPRHLALLEPNPFSFTITNDEGHRVDYHYLISTTGPDGPASTIAASTTISAGGSAVRTAEFVPPEVNATYIITIQLVDRPEFIHFAASS